MPRPFISFLAIFFLIVAIILEFFIILSGGITSMPEDHVWFLQASTNGIPHARNPSRWTYWSVCGVDGNGHNTNCGAVVPALPFSPTDHTNFNTAQGVPAPFVGTKKWFLMSRFAWVFYLLSLLFTIGAFLCSGLSLCTRIGAYLSSINTAFALFWQALAASLMTAWTVQARNRWRAAGHDADYGKYAFGFTWATVAALLIAIMLFCSAGHGRRYSRRKADYV